MEVIEIENLEAMKAFVERLRAAHPNGAVYGLKGDLGAGKTTLVRFFIELLSAPHTPPRVTSPSFVLHQHYAISPPVDHWDLYRLNAVEEEALDELGYGEGVERAREAKGWVFVEWPDRVVPRDLLGLTGEIRIVRESETKRVVYWNLLIGKG